MKPNEYAAHLGLIIVNLLFGINYSIVKLFVPQYIEAFGFIFYRVILATSIYWIIHFRSREEVNWQKDGLRIFLCAIFGVVINQLMFFKGISLTSPINASIILTLVPIFVFVFSVILKMEKLRVVKILGIAAGLTGTLLIIYQPGTRVLAGNWQGDLMVLINSLSYSLYFVLVKPLMTRYSALTVLKWTFAIGLIFILPIGFSEAAATDPGSFTPQVWWSIAFVVLGVTVVAYFLNVWALRFVNPSMAGVYIYSQPVFATVIAVFAFDYQASWIHLISIICVFSGIYLVGKR